MYGPKLKTVLRITGTALSLAAVLVVAACLAWPLGISDPEVETAMSQAERIADQHKTVPKPSIQQFESLLKKQLRRPLIDPPTVKNAETKAVVKKRPMPRVRLLGIALEAGHSLAIFSTHKGEIELKGVGEILGDEADGPRISTIEDRRVVICYRGKEVTLDLEEEIRR